MHRTARPLVALALALLVLIPTSAQADRPMCSEALPDSEVRARLAVLAGAVRRNEPAMRRWWTSFALLHATMASGAGILAGSSQDEGFRNEMLVGAASSTLGLISLLVLNPPLMGAGDSLRDLPDRTPEERLYKLRMAEDVVRRSASGTDFLQSWLPATGSTLYVSAAATTLLFGFERPTGAIVHSIGGAVIGLGRILLHPTGARDAWRRYLHEHPDADCEPIPSTAALDPRFTVFPHALGLGLRVDF